MSLLAMPWVVVNLGCEMLYILDQRLKAQSVSSEKSIKVLTDVMKTMFDKSFLNDSLFIPQPVYSLNSTRRIFDRLAHSSIMRLNEASMDKLFDLMTMGAKYQLMCITEPCDLMKVTQQHLSGIRDLVQPSASPEVLECLSYTEELVAKCYGDLPAYHYQLLKQTLCQFFLNKRVKVSLFLNEGIQTTMGRIVMPPPKHSDVGLWKSFSDVGKIEAEEKLSMAALEVSSDEFFCHPVPLGANLYDKERPKVTPPPRKGDVTPGPISDSHQRPDDQNKSNVVPAQQELNLLAALMRVRDPPLDDFKLNLFTMHMLDDDHDLGPTGGSATTLTLGAGGKNTTYTSGAGQLSAAVQQLGLDTSQADGTEEEDLLDLMDKVAK